MKAAFRRLSENGENNSVPPLRRQPPAVYGEHGVVYVHLFTVPRPARKTKGHVMLQSLNHLTLAVSDLQKASPSGTSCWADAPRPLEYRGLSHLRRSVGLPVVRRGAPVCAAAGERLHPLRVYRGGTDFEPFSHKLEQAGVTVWKQNKSEGASFYFLDPDGHKLELHVGSLAARLAACREKPYAGMVFTSDEA
jgi:catechol 2,3-dioxygenase-like lactoylglutathione lyase family enzyme